MIERGRETEIRQKRRKEHEEEAKERERRRRRRRPARAHGDMRQPSATSSTCLCQPTCLRHGLLMRKSACYRRDIEDMRACLSSPFPVFLPMPMPRAAYAVCLPMPMPVPCLALPLSVLPCLLRLPSK